eukprot:TRINITY_DN59814_c0_g1_i2.p1 TRINITY_DN59814_c0_g1~~TRINITY_DN59814_c0_g1_i2.p1  ORF type:complete len:358 (-),score=28.20 TRINITY_DN59814_c0_g1_i2:183-1256(-)
MSVFLAMGGAALHYSSSCAASLAAATAMTLSLQGSRSLIALLPLLWAALLSVLPIALLPAHTGVLCAAAPAVSAATVCMFAGLGKMQGGSFESSAVTGIAWVTMSAGLVVAVSGSHDVLTGQHADVQATHFRGALGYSDATRVWDQWWGHYYHSRRWCFYLHVASGTGCFTLFPLLLCSSSRARLPGRTAPRAPAPHRLNVCTFMRHRNPWQHWQDRVALSVGMHRLVGGVCTGCLLVCAASALVLAFSSTLGRHVTVSSSLFAVLAMVCGSIGAYHGWCGNMASHGWFMLHAVSFCYGIVFVRLTAAIIAAVCPTALFDVHDYSSGPGIQGFYGTCFWVGFGVSPVFARQVLIKLL